MPAFSWSQFDNGLSLVSAASIAAVGLYALCVGVYMLWRAPVRDSMLPSARRRWGLDAAVDDATLRAALRVLARIRAWVLIFAGAGVTLVPMIWLSIAWFSEGNFRLVGVFNGWGLVLSTGIAIGILGCAGQAYGVHRMRARARNHTAYGDLRPRLVRDFVPNWVGVAFAIWVSALVIVTVVASLFANVPLRTQLDPNQSEYLPLGRWSLIAVPLLAALCLALGLYLLRWMVALPRLKFLDELPDVGVFDAHFRRESILSVVKECALLMYALFWMQWTLAVDNLPPLAALIEIAIGATIIGNTALYFGMILALSQAWWPVSL
jgi:hypothetical protein